MSIVKEFKEFAIKGNAMDLAVGVIIGAAFGKIIDSIVKDLIMPIVAAIIGQPDFSNLYVVLRGDVPAGTPLVEAQKVAGAAIFAYGNFITVAINFLLLAVVVFMMVKGINSLKRKKEAEQAPAPAVLSKEESLLTEIRDLLKTRP
ncbi:large conductance mechanosensitive channel [Pedobacter sp. UYP30]|uniref:large conductance mechanosensitive channel protein MscL n=1 Tax=Pedobacter sp. UYP30 TaxID=1756400 RepID=UPI00339242A3